jgi:DNA mismatch repair protein MSH5
LNGTVTALGRSLLKNWLTRPSLSLATIEQRHNAVACFLRPENMTTASTLHNHLKGISNVPRYLGRMKAGKGRIIDWQGLVKVRRLPLSSKKLLLIPDKFTFHATMIYEVLGELHQTSHVEAIRRVSITRE